MNKTENQMLSVNNSKGIAEGFAHIRRNFLLFSFVVLASALTLIFAFSSQNKAFAQEETSITVSPARQPIDINPGVNYKGTLKVINSGSLAFDFEVSVSPYGVSSEQYDPRFDVKDDLNSIVDWVTFDDYNKTLEPGQTEEVKYELRVPENAAGGGQYAVLFAETIPSTSSASTGVTVGKRVGSLLFAKISGDSTLTGEIVEQKVDSWYQALPARTFARIHNTGNIDADATYGLTVTNLWGKQVFDVTKAGEANVGKKLILPHTTRRVEMNWSQDKTWWGFYKVHQEATFAGATGTVDKWIFYCPLWALIAILVALILVIVLIVLKIVFSKKKKNQPVAPAGTAPINSDPFAQNFGGNESHNAPPAIDSAEYDEYLRFKQWKDSQNGGPQG